MTKNNEALTAAIDDVNSVASELRELQQNIQRYGEASKRLDKVGGALIKLGEGITSLHQGIESIVQRAEQVHEDMANSRIAAEAMTASVPSIVARIEATDTARAIGEFSKLLGEARDILRNQQDTTQGLQTVIDGFSSLTAELQSVKESSTKYSEKLARLSSTLTKKIGEMQLEIKALRDDTSASKKMLTDQSAILKEISKKRFSVF